MIGIESIFLVVAVLLVLVFAGLHIALALIVASSVGIYLIVGNLQVPIHLLQTTAFQFLRDYIFLVIPLFVLMGDLVAQSGAAEDLFGAINRMFRRVPGRLAVAVVCGNTVFAAITGASVASAAAFSRFAYPVMRTFGYRPAFALGSIAGSSVIGMLIPPSVLMVIWGIITGDSIGALFMAGILPGLLLASLYIAYIQIAVKLRPDLAPERPVEKKMKGHVGLGEQNHSRRSEVLSIGGMGLLITLVLGGIWGGFFTPTEAAAVGGIGALVLAVAKGVRPRQIFQTFGETARITSAIMFLLVAAQMYSRMLSMSGVADFVERSVTTLGLTPAGLLLFITLVWLVLGCFIDSASILMLTLPIFWPLNNHLIKMPPLAFGLFGILVVEAGLLTPPFGLVLFTMKASVPGVSLSDIVRGSWPYVLLIVVCAWILWLFPIIATYIPSTMGFAG